MSDIQTTQKKYNSLLIFLHWLTLLFIIGSYATMLIGDSYSDESPEHAMLMSRHFSLGFSILLLVIIRIIIRITTKTPPIIPAPSKLQHQLATLMHFALYIFMVAMPILGWLILSAHGKSLPFWGLSIPPIIGENKDLGHLVHELHETGANIGYALIGLHAVAGLFHHYKIRDNTLRRMSFLKE